MIFKKSDSNTEADEMIQSLLGDSVPSKPVPEAISPTLSVGEKYQLPVRVGRQGKSLDKGDKPWIVGHFSPGVATDKNHPTGHNGMDLKAPEGASVFPIASGIVAQVGQGAKSGNFVVVLHEDGKVRSFYGHMASITAQQNQKVSQKSELGKVGETGNAAGRGAHLHFEVKVNGALINPFGIIGKEVGSLSKKAELFARIEKLAEEFLVQSS